MSPPTNQPRSDDAVLGNAPTVPVGAVVLGGLAGVQQRFQSPIAASRIAALQEASRYGQAGLELLLKGLQDEAIAVQKATYFLLQACQEPKVKRALRTYDPYVLFECLATLTEHRSGVIAVALSPDGRTIASASRDNRLKIWDWWAQESIFTIDTSGMVFALNISLDGRTVVVRYPDRRVRAWSLRNGQKIEPDEATLRQIASVTVSNDRHLISGSQNAIKVWNLKSGREVCSLEGHTATVTSVAVSSTPALLISGSDDHTVKVWGIA